MRLTPFDQKRLRAYTSSLLDYHAILDTVRKGAGEPHTHVPTRARERAHTHMHARTLAHERAHACTHTRTHMLAHSLNCLLTIITAACMPTRAHSQVPALAALWLEGRMTGMTLSAIQRTLLVGMGFQHKTVDELADELGECWRGVPCTHTHARARTHHAHTTHTTHTHTHTHTRTTNTHTHTPHHAHTCTLGHGSPLADTWPHIFTRVWWAPDPWMRALSRGWPMELATNAPLHA